MSRWVVPHPCPLFVLSRKSPPQPGDERCHASHAADRIHHPRRAPPSPWPHPCPQRLMCQEQFGPNVLYRGAGAVVSAAFLTYLALIAFCSNGWKMPVCCTTSSLLPPRNQALKRGRRRRGRRKRTAPRSDLNHIETRTYAPLDTVEPAGTNDSLLVGSRGSEFEDGGVLRDPSVCRIDSENGGSETNLA